MRHDDAVAALSTLPSAGLVAGSTPQSAQTDALQDVFRSLPGTHSAVVVLLPLDLHKVRKAATSAPAVRCRCSLAKADGQKRPWACDESHDRECYPGLNQAAFMAWSNSG